MPTTTAPTTTSVRAGDRDRERTANQLGQALSQGYLAMDEYENRLQAAYVAMVVIVLTVWLAVGLTAGAWYFWPIWPILGAGIGVISHAIPVRFAAPGLCHARPAIDGRRQVSSIG
jgi:hypothetical protein